MNACMQLCDQSMNHHPPEKRQAQMLCKETSTMLNITCVCGSIMGLIVSCSQLERSPDGFSVVAEYFGRGVFTKVRSVDACFEHVHVYLVEQV